MSGYVSLFCESEWRSGSYLHCCHCPVRWRRMDTPSSSAPPLSLGLGYTSPIIYIFGDEPFAQLSVCLSIIQGHLNYLAQSCGGWWWRRPHGIHSFTPWRRRRRWLISAEAIWATRVWVKFQIAGRCYGVQASRIIWGKINFTLFNFCQCKEH